MSKKIKGTKNYFGKEVIIASTELSRSDKRKKEDVVIPKNIAKACRKSNKRIFKLNNRINSKYSTFQQSILPDGNLHFGWSLDDGIGIIGLTEQAVIGTLRKLSNDDFEKDILSTIFASNHGGFPKLDDTDSAGCECNCDNCRGTEEPCSDDSTRPLGEIEMTVESDGNTLFVSTDPGASGLKFHLKTGSGKEISSILTDVLTNYYLKEEGVDFDEGIVTVDTFVVKDSDTGEVNQDDIILHVTISLGDQPEAISENTLQNLTEYLNNIIKDNVIYFFDPEGYCVDELDADNESKNLPFTRTDDLKNKIIADLIGEFRELVEHAHDYGLDIRLTPESKTLELYYHDDYPDTLLVDKYMEPINYNGDTVSDSFIGSVDLDRESNGPVLLNELPDKATFVYDGIIFMRNKKYGSSYSVSVLEPGTTLIQYLKEAAPNMIKRGQKLDDYLYVTPVKLGKLAKFDRTDGGNNTSSIPVALDNTGEDDGK